MHIMRATDFRIIALGLITFSFLVEDVSSEVSDPLQNPVVEPNDVVSVSKFIKDFHGQLEKDLYPIQESDGAIDNESTPVFDEGDSLPANRSNVPEKNHTSIVNCNPTHLGSFNVELVNSTRLISLLSPNPNVTSRHTEAQCVVLLFYSRTCPFSCLAAPHFNALPRAFPSIKMAAVNAIMYQSFNTQYGIAGVPTVILFHNGRAVAKFNDSEYTLEQFARFIVRFTGLKPAEKMFVSSADFGGPVPSRLIRETDYILGLAWLVILVTLAIGVSHSNGWRNLVEVVQNTWREAQAHHEHTE